MIKDVRCDQILKIKSILTIFAFALLDHVLVLEVLVAALAEEPGPGKKIKRGYLQVINSPLDFLCRLRNKKSNRVCRHFGALRVDGDLGVTAPVQRLYFNRQQQQLQLHKAEPDIDEALYDNL
jgi:hypothetical protein